MWRRDGRELFYLAADGKLMAVEVKAGNSFETGEPRTLFALRSKSSPDRQYVASRDGQRFLVNTPLGDQGSPPSTLIQDWAPLARP